MRSQSPSKIQQLLVLIGFLTVCLLIGTASGKVTAVGVREWYQDLRRTSLNLSDWIFGPAWNMLYLTMAVAAWQAWRRRRPTARPRLWLFFLQLGLGLAWSALFFGLQSPGAALIAVVPLCVAVFATLIAFSRIDKWAGMLFMPSVAWTALATLMNAMIWLLGIGYLDLAR